MFFKLRKLKIKIKNLQEPRSRPPKTSTMGALQELLTA